MTMKLVELALLVVGLACLIVGYRKNSRQMLVTAAILLLLSGSLRDLLQGFSDGLTE